MNEHNESNIPPVPPHLFGVVNNAKGAFRFLGQELGYIMRLAAPVMCLKIAMSAAQQSMSNDASSLEIFLWQLPGNIMLGWLICSIARLIILGERLQNLPITDVRFMQYRAGLIKTSIFLGLLIHAGWTMVTYVFENSIDFNTPEEASGTDLGIMISVLVIAFWGVRLLLLPLIAAVDYPLRTFVQQIQGLRISVNLTGLYLLCALPILLFAHAFLGTALSSLAGAPDVQRMLFFIALQPVSVFVDIILTIGFVLALKEMLGQNKKV